MTWALPLKLLFRELHQRAWSLIAHVLPHDEDASPISSGSASPPRQHGKMRKKKTIEPSAFPHSWTSDTDWWFYLNFRRMDATAFYCTNKLSFFDSTLVTVTIIHMKALISWKLKQTREKFYRFFLTNIHPPPLCLQVNPYNNHNHSRIYVMKLGEWNLLLYPRKSSYPWIFRNILLQYW